MKKVFLTAALIALVISFAFPTKTYALWPFDIFTKNSSAGNQANFPPPIQKIIDKFKLNPDEVQKVIDETRDEKQKQMQSLREQRLEQAVKDGVITEEQKKTLFERWNKMWQEHQQEREEMQRWREESGIDFEKLAPYGVGFGRGFGKRGFGKGHWFGGF